MVRISVCFFFYFTLARGIGHGWDLTQHISSRMCSSFPVDDYLALLVLLDSTLLCQHLTKMLKYWTHVKNLKQYHVRTKVLTTELMISSGTQHTYSCRLIVPWRHSLNIYIIYCLFGYINQTVLWIFLYRLEIVLIDFKWSWFVVYYLVILYLYIDMT